MRILPRRLRGVAPALALVVVLAAAAAFSWPHLRVWTRERALARAPRPLSVLLVTLDTTRADRLGCYGHPGGATPQLDALALRGVLFRQAYAHVPLTCPSHASLLTGLLPPATGCGTTADTCCLRVFRRWPSGSPPRAIAPARS